MDATSPDPSDLPDPPPQPNPAVPAAMSGAVPPAGPPVGPRLLVVDDSPHERLALRRLLGPHGYAVHEATDGGEAIDTLKSVQIDVVLLDLEMPGTDGFTVLDYLQEHRRALPVVLLSGMPLDKIQDRMRRMIRPSLPPLLVKPVDPDQVLGVLEMLLDGSLQAGVDEPK